MAAKLTSRQYLLVMRHGKRQDEVEDTWRSTAQQPWDPPLFPDGLAQVVSAAEKLKQYGIDRLVVSPFLRCLETARSVAAVLGVSPERWQVDFAVCEVMKPVTLVGAQVSPPVGPAKEWMWAGKQVSHTLGRVLGPEAESISIAASEFPDFPESISQAHARYAKAFEEIADRFSGENILVITHGEGVGRAITRLIPWGVVYEVQHSGFAVAWRERDEEGDWNQWQLDESAINGISWSQ